MRLGLGVLRMSSEDFWNSTPHELVAAEEGWRIEQGQDLDEGVSITQEKIDELMKKFPDKKSGGPVNGRNRNSRSGPRG